MKHRLLLSVLPVVTLLLAGGACHDVIGVNPCSGASRLVIDTDTLQTFLVDVTVPLAAHVVSAGGRHLPAQVVWSSSIPAAVTVIGATARANFATRAQLRVDACGITATMTFVAVAGGPSH